MKTLLLVAALLAAFSTASPAQTKGGGGSTSGGSAGVITIDQGKAEAGGVTPEDTAGFPVTLSQPGSYRLNGNLSVANPSTSAVLITSPGVTLDLNGFEIRGPNVCSSTGASLNCTSVALPSTALRGHGVVVSMGSEQPGSAAVENGSIRGFMGNGVAGGGNTFNVAVRRVRASHNGMFGISAAGLVSESVADRNVGGGIYGSLGATHNQMVFNRGPGLTSTLGRFNVSWNNGALDVQVWQLD